MTTTIIPRNPQPRAVSVPQQQPLETAMNHFFSPTEEAELAGADHEAWNAVCTVLITIVSLGLFIGIIAVLLIV